jgi:Rieske Fe-S protein
MDRPQPEPAAPDRRGFLSRASTLAMFGGLAAAYGTLAGFMGRFLYPARAQTRDWLFVTDVAGMKEGAALNYRTPAGARVVVARQGRTGTAEDFIALSSTCPHLGCQVHWEPQNDRFFCPCHNGVFTPRGKAIEGPPAKEGMELPRYPLKVEGGLLYIEVPVEVAAQGPGTVEEHVLAGGPGHDPCLEPRRDA